MINFNRRDRQEYDCQSAVSITKVILTQWTKEFTIIVMKRLSVTFFSCLLFSCFAAHTAMGGEFPFNAVNDPYLMPPLSYEATNNIKRMKQEIGDLPSRSENDSFIKNVKQQIIIGKDGIADISEDIEFSVSKNEGDNNVLFVRKYPLSRFDKSSGQRIALEYNIVGIWGTDIDMSSEKNDKYLIITAKSGNAPYKTKKKITGTAHISLQVTNAIAEITLDDEYSSLIYSEDYSLPVDDIFITLSVPDNIKMKNVKSEINDSNGSKENMARIVNNKAGFKTIDGLKNGQLFMINAWFTKGLDKNKNLSSHP